MPLECLPFPAALTDGRGALIAANAGWQAAWPNAAPGQAAAEWPREVHASAPDLREALAAGVEAVLGGALPRFVQGGIVVSPCPNGALIAVQDPIADDLRSHRMESLGRLLGGVTHDFANLLTLIVGYSDILLNRTGEIDPLRSEIYEIRKAAGRGARLTAQLLGFARGAAAEPRPIDINPLVAEIEHMLRPIIGEYIALETVLAPDLGKVIADPGQMEQVIMNLILNARDAMPTGGSIRIQTCNSHLGEAAARARGVRPGPCVLLSIADTGHGMEPETIERVFQPFFTTKERGKGTGLGLSTVLSIVERSGGGIWASSVPGDGASFTLCLPRAPEPAGHTETVTAPRLERAGSETLLLVENDDSVRALLTLLLHRQGYQVIEAANGADALRVFEQRAADIHLVLSDLMMPARCGRELGERLCRIRPGVKVVYMSGYTDDVLLSTGALRPGMPLLHKPLSPDVLAARVREALDTPSLPFNPE